MRDRGEGVVEDAAAGFGVGWAGVADVEVGGGEHDRIVAKLLGDGNTEFLGVRLSSLVDSTHEAVLEDLARLALRAPSRAEFFDEAAARLQLVLPHDGACWHTLDPGSDLVTEHRLQNIPDRFPLIAHNEYQVDDVNKFADLARAPHKAASLYEATGGRLERSPRYRDLLAAGGIGAELRGAFVADGAT